MKVIIQIPCYNEEKTLPLTLADLPREIEGVDSVETLIINDGSSDRTVEIARNLKVDHIVSFKQNKGLARAFEAGIERCLEEGADIIVNTDGDNQYCGGDIPKLVKPIIEGRADVVVGDRQTDKITHFSGIKKKLQKYGTKVIQNLSQTDVKDAVSGFRAYSRQTAMKMNINTDFSYTIENLIQLGNMKERIVSVPVGTNRKLRESRLFKSIPNFISQQLSTIIRVYATYKAMKVFTITGIVLMLPGLLGVLRFLYFFARNDGDGHIQSLVLSAVLINIGFFVVLFGIIADLTSTNRKLIEKTLFLLKRLKEKEHK